LQVLYYLARIEPFSTLSAQLQGAKFDHNDCMFTDVARTWNSVLEGMNDVKELVSSSETSASLFLLYFRMDIVHYLVHESIWIPLLESDYVFIFLGSRIVLPS
jgi:hypothetical protein